MRVQEREPWLNPKDEPLFDQCTKDESLEYMESGWPEWGEYYSATLELYRGGNQWGTPRSLRGMRIPCSDIVSNWHCQMLAVSDEEFPIRINAEEYCVDDFEIDKLILIIN